MCTTASVPQVLDQQRCLQQGLLVALVLCTSDVFQASTPVGMFYIHGGMFCGAVQDANYSTQQPAASDIPVDAFMQQAHRLRAQFQATQNLIDAQKQQLADPLCPAAAQHAATASVGTTRACHNENSRQPCHYTASSFNTAGIR